MIKIRLPRLYGEVVELAPICDCKSIEVAEIEGTVKRNHFQNSQKVIRYVVKIKISLSSNTLKGLHKVLNQLFNYKLFQFL